MKLVRLFGKVPAGAVPTADGLESYSWQVPSGGSGGAPSPTALQSGTATVAAGQYVPFDLSTANGILPLPSAPADKTVIGYKVETFTIGKTLTVTTAGADTFDTGATSATPTLVLGGAKFWQYNATAKTWTALTGDTPVSQLDNRYVSGPLNILAFGADPTGVATSDAAHAAALAQAALFTAADHIPVIYYPKGNYKFAAPVSCLNVSIRGDGRGATKFSLASDLAAANVIATPAAPSGFSSASTGGTLLASTAYAYRAAAFGRYGATGWSAEATFTTPASGTSTNTVSFNVAGVPQNALGLIIYGRTSGGEQVIGRVVAHGASTVAFTDTGAVTPSGYPLQANFSACNSMFMLDCQPSLPLVTPAAPTLAGTAGGTLTPGTTYGYRVASCTQTGKTLASTEATGTPGGSNGSIVVTSVPSVGAQSVEFYGRTPSSELLLGYQNVSSSVTSASASLPTATIQVNDARRFSPSGGKVVVNGQVVTYTGTTIGAGTNSLTGCTGGTGAVSGGTWIGQVVTFTDDGSVTPAGALPAANATGGVGIGAADYTLVGPAPRKESGWEDLYLAGGSQHSTNTNVPGSPSSSPGWQTSGCRHGNGIGIYRPRIDGWFAGIFMFSDHEEIHGQGEIGGAYYGLYYGAPSGSSGDQIIRDVNLTGATWASIAVAAGKNLGGKYIQGIHAGPVFGVYKEMTLPNSSSDLITGGKKWDSVSFESCNNGNIFVQGDTNYRVGTVQGCAFVQCSSTNPLGTPQLPVGTPDYNGRPIDRVSSVVDLAGGSWQNNHVIGADPMDPNPGTSYSVVLNGTFDGGVHLVADDALNSCSANAKLWCNFGTGLGEIYNKGRRARVIRCSPVSTVVAGDLMAYAGLPFGGGSPGQPQVQRYDATISGGGSMRPAGVAAHGGMTVDGSALPVYCAGGPVSIRQTVAIAGGLVVAPDPANAGCVQPLAGVQIVDSQGAPTGGTWTQTFRGQTTAGLARNISASALQTALQGLSTIGAGNVICVGGPLGTTVIWILFCGTLALGYEQPLIVTNSLGLTGGTTPTVDCRPGDPLAIGEAVGASSGGFVPVNLRSL